MTSIELYLIETPSLLPNAVKRYFFFLQTDHPESQPSHYICTGPLYPYFPPPSTLCFSQKNAMQDAGTTHLNIARSALQVFCISYDTPLGETQIRGQDPNKNMYLQWYFNLRKREDCHSAFFPNIYRGKPLENSNSQPSVFSR